MNPILSKIKEILIHLTIECELPSDMNELDENVFLPAFENLETKMEEIAETIALDQYLSDYPKNLSYDEIIEAIENEYNENGGMPENIEIDVWCKFENDTPENLVENLHSTRDHALSLMKTLFE